MKNKFLSPKKICKISRAKHYILILTIVAIGSFIFSFGCRRNKEPIKDDSIRVFRGHKKWITSVAFHPNGREAISASRDKTIRFWDVYTSEETRILKGHKDEIWHIAISPAGTHLASAGKSSIRIWDIMSGNYLAIKKKRIPLISHLDRVAFSRDGKCVISNPGRICVWDVFTGRELRTFERQYFFSIEDLSLSPDGTAVVAAAWFSKKVFLWDLLTGKKLGVLGRHKSWVNSVAFSPDSKYVVSGSLDQTICLWEVSTGKKVMVFNGKFGNVWSVAFSPDGRFILSGGDDRIVYLWDVLSGKELKKFSGHSSIVLSVAFSPDGHYALSGSTDNTLRLWDIYQ